MFILAVTSGFANFNFLNNKTANITSTPDTTYLIKRKVAIHQSDIYKIIL